MRGDWLESLVRELGVGEGIFGDQVTLDCVADLVDIAATQPPDASDHDRVVKISRVLAVGGMACSWVAAELIWEEYVRRGKKR
jgi:hypothetical protein